MSVDEHKVSFYLKMIAQLVDNLAIAAAENENLKKQLTAALSRPQSE